MYKNARWGVISVIHLIIPNTQFLILLLQFWKEKRRHILVCISAASNVTGIITNTDDVATLAHKHGALVAFDYAGGGPYLKIDMNSSKQR